MDSVGRAALLEQILIRTLLLVQGMHKKFRTVVLRHRQARQPEIEMRTQSRE